MKIEILKETNWGEKFRRTGDRFDVPDKVGQRWINHKIAKAVETPSGGAGGNQNNYQKTSTVAELKEQAKQLEIEGYTKMNKEQLTAAIAEAEELKTLQDQARSFGVSSVETMTKEELEEAVFLGSKVIELNIEGHENMTKEQLLEAIAEKSKINETGGQS